jgi:hypothetical protein
MQLVYDLDIVGGEFDGAPGLKWLDDGKHPLPELIFVGVCSAGMDCGSSACRLPATHVSYWLPVEADRPTTSQPYRKQEEFVVRGEDGELAGRAVYAMGGLLDPSNFGEKAREPVAATPAFPSIFAGERDRTRVPSGRHEQGYPRAFDPGASYPPELARQRRERAA